MLGVGLAQFRKPPPPGGWVPSTPSPHPGSINIEDGSINIDLYIYIQLYILIGLSPCMPPKKLLKLTNNYI